MILESLWVVFFASAAIQFIYLLFIFGHFTFSRHNPQAIDPEDLMEEGVSVIVASRNELKNLKNLLPALSSQNYPKFEILIVNDRSTDGTRSYLRKMMNVYPQ